MTTTRIATLHWLRRRASAMLGLMVLAIIFVAILAAMRAQARPTRAATVPEAALAVSPALVQAEWQARAEEAVEHAAQAHQNAIEAASPASTPAEWQARTYERTMQRLLELNTMDDPSTYTLPPARDAGQRTGPY